LKIYHYVLDSYYHLKSIIFEGKTILKEEIIMMKFFKEEKGQGLSEYGLILALIAVVAIGALTLLGGDIKDKITEVACKIKGGTWDATAKSCS